PQPCRPPFCSVLLCPPVFSLLPYTTLFRSALIDQRRPQISLPSGRAMTKPQGAPARPSGRALWPCLWPNRLLPRASVRHTDPLSDRKSTRLNSSHEWISYAVFCLKEEKDTP